MKGRTFYVPIVLVSLLGFSGHVWANNFVVGHNSTADVPLTSATNWTIIRRATITIPAVDPALHGCVATASADVFNIGIPLGSENQYLFVLTRNDSNPPTGTGSERIVGLVDNNGINDPDSQTVSTTRHFTSLTRTNGVTSTGRHTFYFLGRKVDAGHADTTVLGASLSVMCVDTP